MESKKAFVPAGIPWVNGLVPVYTPPIGEVGSVWQKCCVELPADIPEERVRLYFAQYRNKAGSILEAHGFRVLCMTEPEQAKDFLTQATLEPDRQRYVWWAKITRRPQQVLYKDLPDAAAADLQQDGMKLVD